MPPVGFEPTISAGERPKTYALDSAATGTGYTGNITGINQISMFHGAFFNSIIDKHQHMHFFIQHYITLECWFH